MGFGLNHRMSDQRIPEIWDRRHRSARRIMRLSIQKKGETMILLHIEHMVSDFDTWKASFDTYTELRQQSGVRRYRVSRPIDNPQYAIIDLEFDNLNGAESLLAGVQQVWQRVGGTLIQAPQWRICEVVEMKELQLSDS